jgi:hypothetical protein
MLFNLSAQDREYSSEAVPLSETNTRPSCFVRSTEMLISEDHSLTNLRASYSKPLIGKSAELAPVLGA